MIIELLEDFINGERKIDAGIKKNDKLVVF
jgi:hypothetical protein